MRKTINGVVIGTVLSREDPQGEGRIQVTFPWLPGNNRSYWAPIATLMAGGSRGAWFQPELGDEVLVAFEHGDVDHPFIVGFLWNGEDRPPESDPRRRVIRSVNGHEIVLYDPEPSAGDKGYIRIKDAHGNSIELSNSRITISSVGSVEINAKTVSINGRLVAPTPRPI